jgi:mono/diheme cytochrome c family protein
MPEAEEPMTRLRDFRLFSCQAAAVAALALVPAAALPDRVGEQEFMDFCAVCHGIEADGKGPMRTVLSVAVPPLTGLSMANGGVFPMSRVIEIIDGRSTLRGHGATSMPVWGTVYTDPTQAGVDPEGARLAVRRRILALAEYLESIQD